MNVITKLKKSLSSEKEAKPGKGCMVNGCNEPRDRLSETYCETHERVFEAINDAKIKIVNGVISSAHYYDCSDCSRYVVVEGDIVGDSPQCPECGSESVVAVEIIPGDNLYNL